MAKCNAKFERDPSYRDLKCELPKGHSVWHECGLTLWANDEEKPEHGQKARKQTEVISIG